MRNQLAAFLFLVLLVACKKDNEEKKEDKIYFTGIISTDQNGNYLSGNDSSDWKANDIWVSKEAALFSRSYQTNCTAPSNLSVVNFPNPTPGLFSMNFFKPDNVSVDLRLVDENFNVLFSLDSVTAPLILIKLDSLKINDTARMYYKFISNGCEFRGHGDILFKQ